MKELVVISGKGGTGKTSIVASFAALSRNAVLVDCDVDAADLHLILDPTIQSRSRFSGGSTARVKTGHCTACGKCEELCRYDAIFFDGPGNGRFPKTFRIDPVACEGCGVCAWFCMDNAIDFSPADGGEWYISDTRFGPFVHAALGIAEENSGKLVSLVRREAKELAEKRHAELIIIDGSPGIGCPVIASITGADVVLVVTEPTLSGLHDLGRVIELTRYFNIPSLVCVNKWDLNSDVTSQIEAKAQEAGSIVVGRVRYDQAVTKAQIKGQALVEFSDDGAAEDVRQLWGRIAQDLAFDAVA